PGHRRRDRRVAAVRDLARRRARRPARRCGRRRRPRCVMAGLPELLVPARLRASSRGALARRLRRARRPPALLRPRPCLLGRRSDRDRHSVLGHTRRRRSPRSPRARPLPGDRSTPSSLARFAQHHTAYRSDGYVIARDLLPAIELAALRRYYAALLAAGLVPLGDRQSVTRFSIYNDPIGRFLHTRLARAMSAVVGQPVVPSFSYFFSYIEGAALEPHKDRPQAE